MAVVTVCFWLSVMLAELLPDCIPSESCQRSPAGIGFEVEGFCFSKPSWLGAVAGFAELKEPTWLPGDDYQGVQVYR